MCPQTNDRILSHRKAVRSKHVKQVKDIKVQGEKQAFSER